MAKNDLLIAWLNDASATGRAQGEMLERFVKDFDGFPNIRARIREHLDGNKRAAEDIKVCIERLGGSLPATKSLFGSIVGAVQGMSTGPYKDEPVKNLLVMHAAGHFEHVAHRALAAGARACGENDVATVCEHIAQEEKAFAEWIEQQIPKVVTAVMEDQGDQLEAAAP